MRRRLLGAIALSRPGRNDSALMTRKARFDEIESYVEGAQGLDFLCLPELFATEGVFKEQDAPREPLGSGPASEFCSKLAKKLRSNVVTTILAERDGAAFNAGVIFDRNGALAGTYDKVHPASGEKIVAGDKFPVFDIDGAKIGIQICFDLNFPEGCRSLAVQGVDAIFWPTMWIGPAAHFIDCIMRARAMENFCFLVASGYIHYGVGMEDRSICPTGVVSWDGCIVAQAGTRPGLSTAWVDLDEPRRLQGLREDHFAARRPELYSLLTRKTPAK